MPGDLIFTNWTFSSHWTTVPKCTDFMIIFKRGFQKKDQRKHSFST